MKMTKAEETSFHAAGEPRNEPDYSAALFRLQKMLSPEQEQYLYPLLTAFGETVQYERRWYFHKGWLAAKRSKPE